MTPHPSVSCYDRSPSFCSKYIDVSEAQVLYINKILFYTLHFLADVWRELLLLPVWQEQLSEDMRHVRGHDARGESGYLSDIYVGISKLSTVSQ